jgi:ATPase subunit of ABC transporter with duplicated ATPase domains
MPAIHLEHLSFSYTSAVVVFEDLSLHFGPGWTGVVGPNGGGKSTLLGLIAGDLVVDMGSVRLDPHDAHVVRCRQEVDEPTDEIEAFSTSIDGAARRWLGLLALDPSAFWRWSTLSPGERKRWQLGAALAAEPHVLLLDEPTNHLDREARRLVNGALKRFPGVGLVISHDRRFLDELTTRTLRVMRDGSQLWNGSYSTARVAWQAEQAAAQERYDKARRRERSLSKRLADERRAAEQREAEHRRKVRTSDQKDHDARSMEAKGRYEGGQTTGARRRAIVRADLERTREDADGIAFARRLGRSVFFEYEPSPKRRLLAYDGPLIAGDQTLAEHVVVAVERGQRIRLIGPNGAGKSTLLARLVARSAVPADRLLYLPQELTSAETQTLLAGLRALPSDEKGRVLSLVAALGVDPDDLLASDAPSPGEARKLAMSLGLGRGAWGLVLDEPTNHLDLPAVERLEAALDQYPGAMLVVTHDEAFAAETTTVVWHLEGGELHIT